MQTTVVAVPESPSDTLNDKAFLAAVGDYSLPCWDHKTHIRLAYIVLRDEGRRKAVTTIMSLIEKFIKNSIRTNGRTFHVSMTYFWLHLIHLAMLLSQIPLGEPPAGETDAADDVRTFNAFLERNLWLLNGGLFKKFYRDETLLRNEEARRVFVPPDLQPLPSVLPIRK